jgi:hypothetical protein
MRHGGAQEWEVSSTMPLMYLKFNTTETGVESATSTFRCAGGQYALAGFRYSDDLGGMEFYCGYYYTPSQFAPWLR